MFVLLWTLIFVYHVAFGFYQFHGLETLPELDFIYQVAFVCGLVWLLRAEERRSAVTPVYCQGMLFGIGWLISHPLSPAQNSGCTRVDSVAGVASESCCRSDSFDVCLSDASQLSYASGDR